jgi:hypothetical protein
MITQSTVMKSSFFSGRWYWYLAQINPDDISHHRFVNGWADTKWQATHNMRNWLKRNQSWWY